MVRCLHSLSSVCEPFGGRIGDGTGIRAHSGMCWTHTSVKQNCTCCDTKIQKHRTGLCISSIWITQWVMGCLWNAWFLIQILPKWFHFIPLKCHKITLDPRILAENSNQVQTILCCSWCLTTSLKTSQWLSGATFTSTAVCFVEHPVEIRRNLMMVMLEPKV